MKLNLGIEKVWEKNIAKIFFERDAIIPKLYKKISDIFFDRFFYLKNLKIMTYVWGLIKTYKKANNDTFIDIVIFFLNYITQINIKLKGLRTDKI